VRLITDQLGFEVRVPYTPARIISLVPSQTELLFDLGVASRVFGVTKFCIHPVEAKSKTIVGGTKNFHFDTIDSLKPALIIGNKEENDQASILHLRDHFPVWLSDITTLDDAIAMIKEVGEMVNADGASKRIVHDIGKAFDNLAKLPPLRVLYFIWRKPWMVAGTDTFIHHLISRLGLENVAPASRYPVLTLQEISQIHPDIIFLSSEPYPFAHKHQQELQQLCPASRIILVDGEMFSWYGSRLKKAPSYFEQLGQAL